MSEERDRMWAVSGALAALLCALAACGGDDAAAPDGGTTPMTDGGGDEDDAGTRPDAGGMDGGGGDVDGGPGADGGGGDGGAEDGGSGSTLPALGDQTSEEHGRTLRKVSIAIGSDGEPRVVGMSLGSGSVVPPRVWLMTRDGGTWSDEELYTYEGDAAEVVAAALGADDAPHVLIVEDGMLRYVHRDGGAWTVVDVDSESSSFTGTHRHFDIALDAAGVPHVGYLDVSSGSLKYGVWNGSSFDVEVVDEPTEAGDRYGDYARLAVAADGTVHLSYLALVADEREMRHATGPGTWAVETVPGEARGVHGTILLDSSDHPHVVSAGLMDLHVRGVFWSRFDGSAWTETMLEPLTAPIEAMDAAMDPADRPHILYSNDVLAGMGPWVYQRYDGSAFERYPRTIGGPASPSDVSLAIDDAFFPHIAITGRVYIHF